MTGWNSQGPLSLLFVLLILCSKVWSSNNPVRTTAAFIKGFKQEKLTNIFWMDQISDKLVHELSEVFPTEFQYEQQTFGFEFGNFEELTEISSTRFIVVIPDEAIGKLRDASEEELRKHVWLLMVESDESLSALQDLLFGKLRLDSEIFVCRDHAIYELYQLTPESAVISNELGHIDISWNFAYSASDIIWERRGINFEGLEFKAVYVDFRPYVYKDENGTLRGLMYEVAVTLKEALNFKLELIEENVYGHLLPNGTWLGLIGKLQSRQADLSISDVSITQTRSGSVDFAIGIIMQYAQLFMHIPKQSLSWTTFINVYDELFWIILAITVLVTATLYHLIVSINGENTGDRNIFKGLASVLMSFGALSIQENPTKFSSRTLFFTICLFGAVVYWSYNAILVSLLTVEFYNLPIQSLADLAANVHDYKIMMEEGNVFSQTFEEATDRINPEAKLIYDELIKDNPQAIVKSYKTAGERLAADPNLVFLVESASAKLKLENYPCFIKPAPRKHFKNFVSFAFPKGSPYTDLFSYRILEMIQSGQVDKLVRKYLGILDLESCEEHTSFKPIKYENIFTAFLILVLGLGFSVILALFEWLYQRI